MKRKRRYLLLLLVSLLLCSCLWAQYHNDKVIIRIKTPPITLPYDDQHLDAQAYDMFQEAVEKFQAQYETYDVEFIIEKYQYVDEKQQVIDKIGTEDAADIIFAGSFNIPTYILKKQIVPLNDIVDDTLRNDIDEAVWRLCSSDGNIYTLPYFQLQNTLLVNQSMMEDAKLSQYIPEQGTIAQWSTEEFNVILTTLKESMQQTMTYPMFMYGFNHQGDVHIMMLLRAYGSSLYDEEGYFHLSTPEGIQALAWIKAMDQQGWIPKGSENMELMSMINLYNKEQLAIVPGNQVNYKYAVQDLNIPTFLANFPSLEGSGYATTYINGFNIFDNGDQKKITVAKDFLRFLYSDPQLMKYAFAGTPVNQSLIESYEGEIDLLTMYHNNSKNIIDFLNNTPNWQGVRAVFYQSIQKLLRGDLTPEEAAKQIDLDCNEAIKEGRNGI